MYYVYWISALNHTDPFTEGYIGLSNQPKKRLKAHTTDTASVGNKEVREFVNEFGLNAIKHTILHEYADLQSAQNKELEYRPNAKIGWNITKGGGITPDCTGRKHSPETIAKITSKNKETKSQRNYVSHFKGKTGRWSDEQKQKIGSYHKGKTISEAHKQAVKDKNSGFNNSKSNNIIITDTVTGITKQYGSMLIASKELNVNYSAIRSAWQNKREMVYKRYKIHY